MRRIFSKRRKKRQKTGAASKPRVKHANKPEEFILMPLRIRLEGAEILLVLYLAKKVKNQQSCRSMEIMDNICQKRPQKTAEDPKRRQRTSKEETPLKSSGSSSFAYQMK